MSFARNDAPTPETHEPITVIIPNESDTLAVGRKDLPTPSLWQRAVKVVRKIDGKEAVVHRVDYATMMFRAFYPDEPSRDNPEELGRHADRTEWEHCRDWNVAVRFTEKELARQAAKKKLDEEIAKMDGKSLALAKVLCDDDDPNKALAKLELLIASGLVVQMSDEAAKEVAAMAVAEVPPEPAATRPKRAPKPDEAK